MKKGVKVVHNIEIARRIKLIREALDLTQEEFGKGVGKSLNTILSWDAGPPSRPGTNQPMWLSSPVSEGDDTTDGRVAHLAASESPTDSR